MGIWPGLASPQIFTKIGRWICIKHLDQVSRCFKQELSTKYQRNMHKKHVHKALSILQLDFGSFFVAALAYPSKHSP